MREVKGTLGKIMQLTGAIRTMTAKITSVPCFHTKCIF